MHCFLVDIFNCISNNMSDDENRERVDSEEEVEDIDSDTEDDEGSPQEDTYVADDLQDFVDPLHDNSLNQFEEEDAMEEEEAVESEDDDEEEKSDNVQANENGENSKWLDPIYSQQEYVPPSDDEDLARFEPPKRRSARTTLAATTVVHVIADDDDEEEAKKPATPVKKQPSKAKQSTPPKKQVTIVEDKTPKQKQSSGKAEPIKAVPQSSYLLPDQALGMLHMLFLLFSCRNCKFEMRTTIIKARGSISWHAASQA